MYLARADYLYMQYKYRFFNLWWTPCTLVSWNQVTLDNNNAPCTLPKGTCLLAYQDQDPDWQKNLLFTVAMIW